ncbi:hypothetical protein EV702DRAFT_1221191 [Suillus placidus]|uniref:Uncharacterized protein n=1 Tax=Suillus placidus TaxID=48579 RepID=A0A9P6ZX98_9AGAM|nr:hypothetical protein EV702DRAFT_1221191 [Suillus placidus]
MLEMRNSTAKIKSQTHSWRLDSAGMDFTVSGTRDIKRCKSVACIPRPEKVRQSDAMDIDTPPKELKSTQAPIAKHILRPTPRLHQGSSQNALPSTPTVNPMDASKLQWPSSLSSAPNAREPPHSPCSRADEKLTQLPPSEAMSPPSAPSGPSRPQSRNMYIEAPSMSLYVADDFDANGDFILTRDFSGVSGDDFDPVSSTGSERVPNINQINWDDPSLYTMPLTNDEIAALTKDIAATNIPTIPELPAPPARTPSPQPSPTEAEKASRKIKRDQKLERTKHLHDAVAEYLNAQKMKIEALSRAHHVTPKHINDIIGSQTHYRTSRKSQLINALVHAKAKEMNTEPYQGRKEGYIAALEEHRKKKVVSVRANNLAAARDIVATMDRIVKELDDLRVRTGVYGTLFVVRGHINDTIQSVMHGTDNSEDFWEDVYEHPMADFLRQYEQWACTQNQNLNERDSLEAVRKQVRKLILRGLVAVTGKKDIVMNYNNYEMSVIETYGVRLVGWPHGVKFTSPSNIGTVSDIRKLRDALKAPGEVVRKPRKKRSDTGLPRKRKDGSSAGRASKENHRPSKKAKKNPAQLQEGPKSAEYVESSGEEEGDE